MTKFNDECNEVRRHHRQTLIITRNLNINTFIFDLGGVIIDLNESATIQAFSKISNKTKEEILSLSQSTDAFINYEKGLINDENFREEIKKLFGSHLDNQGIDDAWNAMLGAIPIERLNLLSQLKEKYKVIILSNTNAIHIRAFNNILKETSGKNSLSYFANFVFFSHKLHIRKPDVEIYRETLKLCDSNAESSLFLDDKVENLLGAKSVGIHTQHILHPNQILELEKYVR